ncbi:MAG: autotransporter-associated beta strand repeat-containing protein [Akkermansiaceae bacterium]
MFLTKPIRAALAAVFAALSLQSAFAIVEADLLVGYDQTYASANGGGARTRVIIANAVAASNAVNERSGTPARLRIVGYHQAAQYSFNRTTNGGFVNWMINRDSRLVDVVDAGDARGADLVTFICESSADNVSAVAQQPGRFSSFDPSAFWGTLVAHEIGGHNYGCDHRGGRENPKTAMLHNYCGGGAQGWFSNPNVWLNGVSLRGEGSCLGVAVDGGDNALRISSSAQGTADNFARVAAPPNLGNVVRRWSFNQPPGTAPAGTTVTDSIGGSAQVSVLGNGATFTGSGLLIPGGTSGSGAAYLRLPPGTVSAYTNLTMEIWATPRSMRTWARIFDFNNGNTNYLTLTSAVGTNFSNQRFGSVVAGTTVELDSALPTVPGVLHHYAITFTSTGASSGRWTWFRNGDEVALLNVAYSLATFPDVNNWLGRSAFANDDLAHCEYAEVRISNVAMNRDQILGNYSLGPNHSASAVFLTADDPLGQTSFAAAGRWSDTLVPSSGKSYETYNSRLRTPTDGISRIFAGQSLALTGGSFTWKGTSSNTITVNNLALRGSAELLHAGSGTFTMAGNLAVQSDNTVVRAAGGNITLAANLSGSQSLLFVDNTTTLSGSNSAFSGKIAIGDGRTSAVSIDSEARLGAIPATLVPDQLFFDRGTLQTSGNLAISAPNRGITLGINGGRFQVNSGTLTLTSPLYTPDTGPNVRVGSFTKSGPGTLVLNSSGSNFRGVLFVDSGSSTANDGILRVANNQVLANVHRVWMNNTGTGSSTLELDGTSGAISLPRVEFTSRDGSTPAIRNAAGTNTIGGLSMRAGGANHIVQSDSGLLNISGSIYSDVSGTRTITFQGNGDIATLNTISELAANLVNVVKQGNGTLTLAGVCGHDGATTVNGGTLRLNGTLQTASSTLVTAPGTILAGTGTSQAISTISGRHAPGNATNSTGIQTFTGPLAYTAGAELAWTLTANNTTANSRVSAQAVNVAAAVEVDLVFNGPGSTVDFTSTFWSQARSWPVLTASQMSGQFQLGSVSADSAGRPISAYGSFILQQSGAGVTLSFFPPASAPPVAPVGLTTFGSPGMVTLGWSPAPTATSYHVKRSTNALGPFEIIATNVTTTTFNDTAVEDGTIYYYVIVGLNSFGEGNASTAITALPHLPTTIGKASNTLSLQTPASWTGGFVPSPFDIASWTALPGSNSVALGADMTLNGIIIGTTGGAVTLSAGNTLSLGSDGINMSAATQNLTLAAGLKPRAGEQSWKVASGRTLTLNGSFSRDPGASLVLDATAGIGTVTSSPFTNTNGIAGPWAIQRSTGAAANNTAAGHTYLSKNASNNLVPYLDATPAAAFGWPSANNNTFNYDVAAVQGVLGVERRAHTARYTGAAGTQDWGNNNTTTITLNGLMNAGTGTLTFGETGGANQGQLAIGTHNSNELVLAAAGANLVINIPIINTGSTPGSLVVTGPNTVTLGGAGGNNTFTGGLHLNSGTLQLGQDTALGTGTLTISGGEIRAIGAPRTFANTVVLNGDFTLGRTTNFSGPLSLARNLTLTSANPDALPPFTSTLSGPLSGPHALTITEGPNPTGTLILSGGNTHTGGTILQAGSLRVGHPSGLGASTARLTVNGGTLDLNALSPTVGALSGSGGVITNLANGSSVLTSNSSVTSVFGGVLQNGGPGQTLAFTKNGPGRLTLSAAHTHSGGTSVLGGSLILNGSLASAVTVANTATLGGIGTITAPLTIQSGGTLAPGPADGIGRLQVSSGLTLQANAILRLDLDKSSATRDVLAVTGTLARAGSLIVTNLAGALAAGDRFTIIEAANPTGAFTTITLPELPEGLEWDLSEINSGVIEINATTPPGITYPEWAAGYPFAVGEDGPAFDADADGIANAFELLFGSEPLEPDTSVLPVGALRTVIGTEFSGADPSKKYLSITATIRKNISGMTLVPQAADSPALLDAPSSSEQIISLLIEDLGGFEKREWIHTVPIDQAARAFMRLKLVQD